MCDFNDMLRVEHEKSGVTSVNGKIDVASDLTVAPRWISVTERLPDKPGIYAVWTAKGFGNHLSASYFDGDSWSLRITHWMPLPQPPKEET